MRRIIGFPFAVAFLLVWWLLEILLHAVGEFQAIVLTEIKDYWTAP